MTQSLLNTFIEQERYTFSDYFNSPLAVRDIARGFGYTLEQTAVALPCLDTNTFDLTWLKQTLALNQRRIRLENETARREALVAPVLTSVCEISNLQYDTEYGITISPHLTGVIDYWLEAQATLLIVEAKESDLVRGFKQLIPELIASRHWKQDVPLLFGGVTDGERWQFATLDRAHDLIQQQQHIYKLTDLETLIGTLVAILQKHA